MAWLAALSAYRWIAIGVVGLALLAAIGFDHGVTIPRLEGQVNEAQKDLANEKTGRAQDAATANEKAVKQADDFRKREQGWQTAVNGAIEDGNKRETAALAARDAVALQRDRLRHSNEALLSAARRAPSGAPAPPECAPAIAAADLLGGMFDRISEAAGAIAADADRQHNAASVCAAAWPVNAAVSIAP